MVLQTEISLGQREAERIGGTILSFPSLSSFEMPGERYCYGLTDNGEKVHVGKDVAGSVQRRDRDYFETFCRNFIHVDTASDEMPYATQARDFCKICFRSQAWEIMVKTMEERAAAGNFAARLEDLAEKADRRGWGSSYILRKVRELARDFNREADDLLKFVPPTAKSRISQSA